MGQGLPPGDVAALSPEGGAAGFATLPRSLPSLPSLGCGCSVTPPLTVSPRPACQQELGLLLTPASQEATWRLARSGSHGTVGKGE